MGEKKKKSKYKVVDTNGLHINNLNRIKLTFIL